MNYHRIITALLLMAPAAVWAGDPIAAPEPEVLPLLAVGVAVAAAVKLMKRKK